MAAIASRLIVRADWQCLQPITLEPNTIVPPSEIASAGRFQNTKLNGKSVTTSAIFSKSVPFDVMVNVDARIRGSVDDCLSRSLECRDRYFGQICEVIGRTDVQCMTFNTDAEGMQRFGNICAERLLEMETNVIFSSDHLMVVSLGYLTDSLLIVGRSEAEVAESQTVLQNLFRIRGAAQYLTTGLRDFHDRITAFESRYAEIFERFEVRIARRRMEALRVVRSELFHMQKAHSALEIQFGYLGDYESLYFDETGPDLQPYAALVREIRDSCLLQVKLAAQGARAQIRNIGAFVDDALQLNYAETNIGLSRSTRFASYIQAVIAILLLAIAAVQIGPLLQQWFGWGRHDGPVPRSGAAAQSAPCNSSTAGGTKNVGGGRAEPDGKVKTKREDVVQHQH